MFNDYLPFAAAFPVGLGAVEGGIFWNLFSLSWKLSWSS